VRGAIRDGRPYRDNRFVLRISTDKTLVLTGLATFLVVGKARVILKWGSEKFGNSALNPSPD
jgi:hypothetical protein